MRRADLRQVHVREGRATVLRDHTSVVLSDVATTILMATSTGALTSLDDIVDTVVAKLGRPEPPLEVAEVVRGLVEELIEHELLVTEERDQQAATASSEAALRDALRHLVSGASESWRLPAGVTGSELLAAAQRHRVTQTLAMAHGRLAVPEATVHQLIAIAEEESAAVNRLTNELAGAVEALARHDLRVLAFDGVALALQAHGQPMARGTDHHSLLVAPTDVEGAIEVLTSLGWLVATGFPHPGPSEEWQHFVRDYGELPLLRQGSAIGLHWQLDTDGAETSEFDSLWSRQTTLSVGLASVPALSPYDALAHAIRRASTSQPSRLRDLLDVWLLAAQPSTWAETGLELTPSQVKVLAEAVSILGMPTDASETLEEAVRFAVVR